MNALVALTATLVSTVLWMGACFGFGYTIGFVVSAVITTFLD